MKRSLVALGIPAFRDIRTSMYIIEPIAKEHNRKAFTCKKPSLANYLQKHARQNDEKNIAKSFVAVDENNTVHGYYSLCTSSIEFEELPENLKKNIPKYPIPAALIAKLAVDLNSEGKGLGTRLLIDALQRIHRTSEQLAIKVVLVDAIDEEAAGYYLHFGFIQLPRHELKLFLPIETISQLLNK